MIRTVRLPPAGIAMLALLCLIGVTGATSMGIVWTDKPYTESPFTKLTFTVNDTKILAGGDQLLFRSWLGDSRWGGRSGNYATMSEDGKYLVTGIGNSIFFYDSNGNEIWSRTMDGEIRGIAMAKDASLVVSADNKGNYNTWGKNGEFYGRNTTDLPKKIAVSPKDNLIVMTTVGGMRIYTPSLDPVWVDNRSGSLDEYILISADGSTIITAGGSRLSSHASRGTLNWMTDVTNNAIIDMAANPDCSVIIIGSQDSTVVAVDRYGRTHWTYKTGGQWANAVGISSDASVIAAGLNDGTIHLLGRSGKLVAKKQLDTAITPRALAVSHDGTKIAAADQRKLYGIEIFGDTSTGESESFTVPPLNPIPSTTRATPTPATGVVTQVPVQTTEVPPSAAPTQKSAPGMIPVIGALATGMMVLIIRKK